MKTHDNHILPTLLTTFVSAVSTKKDKPPHQLLANLEAKIKQIIIGKRSESPITYILLSVGMRFSTSGYNPESKSGKYSEESTIYNNTISLQSLANTLKSHH